MNGIVSRLQVFLAKIAGKDVDVSTLTPPVAINEEERLMLDIADRIDAIEESGGGGGDTFDVIITSAWDETAGEDIYTCNKTFSEISAEHAAHGMNRMRASWVREGNEIFSPMSFSAGEITEHGVPLDYGLTFIGNGFAVSEFWVTYMIINASGITTEDMSFTLTPTA